MGSVGSLADKVKDRFRKAGRFKMSPENVVKLIRARDAKLMKILDEHMGVSMAGLIDGEGNIDQQAMKGRMILAGVTLKSITQHADPRDNGIVLFKNGVAEIAISQPFIDKRGRIKCVIVEPRFLIGDNLQCR
jgi:hypothetical protein